MCTSCMCARVRPHTPTGCAFSAGIRDIDGVPCTRYHVLSVLAISQHDKFFQPRAPRGPDPDPFSLLPSARAICVCLFCPADTRDVARRRCNPRIVLSIANGFCWHESIANRITFFSSSPAESRVIYLQLVQTIVLVLIYLIYLIGNI